MGTFNIVEIDGKPTVKAIEDPLPAGTNILGKVDINDAGGLGLEATLQSILTELQQKTEPASVQSIGDPPNLDVALSTRLADATLTARLNTLGQKASSASAPVVLSTDQSPIPITTTGGEEATYTAIALAVPVGNNKSLLSIYNPTGSAYTLKLREFYIRNAQTTAVTGVVGAFQLMRFASVSAPTGGAAVTPIAHDSLDDVPTAMDARTGGIVSGEVATPLDIMRISTDDWGPGTLDVEAHQQSVANYLPARAKRDGLLKPFYARAGEGLHIKFATNSTAGAFDIVLVFSKV